MADDNEAAWNAGEFQLYASHKTEEIERKISQLNHEIWQTAKEVFRDEEVAGRLIEGARAAGRANDTPSDITYKLRWHPDDLGDLRGGILNPGARSRAISQTRNLAIRVEARADAEVTLKRYEDLYQQALNASRLPEAERDGELEKLRASKEYCDVTQTVREREDRDRRDEAEREEPPRARGWWR